METERFSLAASSTIMAGMNVPAVPARRLRKYALILLLGMILPALVLAALAVHSLQNQQLVLERQQALLYQRVADDLVLRVKEQFQEKQRSFGGAVEDLVGKSGPALAAPEFDMLLRHSWSPAEVGFAVDLKGVVLSPSMLSDSQAREFRIENDKFLCSRESVQVFWQSEKGPVNLSALDSKMPGFEKIDDENRKVARKVSPKAATDGDADSSWSKVAATEADFQKLVSDADHGTIARFLQNRLNVMIWYRPASERAIVFGALLSIPRLVSDLSAVFQTVPESMKKEIHVAILDDSAKPRLFWPERFSDSWKNPLVAAEIGEMLPHWEIAIYPADPVRLTRNAIWLKASLGGLTALMVLAITGGAWLISQNIKKELALVQQRTDFVSSVSHEFKTPLTSIRMFTEMLEEGRVPDAARQRQFLGIISAETMRLGRLINNVLDFAAFEKGRKKIARDPMDLRSVVEETISGYRLHLERDGFRVDLQLPSDPVPIRADRDAVVQILLNLLSNAEKYAPAGKEIRVELSAESGFGVVRVLDRGPGVPPEFRDRIFEQFFRGPGGVDNGVSGAGLGLTLSRQLARALGGDVDYEPREGGGSLFRVRLPLHPAS